MSVTPLAIGAAQAIIRAAKPNLPSGGDFLIDGRWGSTTQAQYDLLNPVEQERVNSTLLAAKSSITEVNKAMVDRKSRESANLGDDAANWIAADKLEALVRRACAEQDMMQYVEALSSFASLEPARKTLNGTTYYNVKSKNGSSRGLFQMQPAAWADAQRQVALPAYDVGVFDPWHNTRAMVAYAKYLIFAKKVGLRDRGWPVTGSTLYAAYNQGLGGLAAMAQSGRAIEGKQSKQANAIAQEAVRSIRAR